ncbi:trypsin-like peptidase domain-containing protein [Streptomyces sp. NPDC021224]|uniref:trypsin-like peptidase domain-containing protein n=1 Tax=unclassified Streptomyces TaxID=2593676 RepID=UPI00379C5A44
MTVTVAAAKNGGPDSALIRVCDLAGRPRGTGFLADAHGTMVTSHEAVDGLARLVLHAPGGRLCLAESAAITPLPEQGLALVATEGLGVPPLPVAVGGPAHPERRIRVRLPHRTDGAVIGAAAVTYTATDRFHLIENVYELALDGADMCRVAPQASGAPVIDAATGAVLGVVATALHTGHRAAGFALPLRRAGAPPALAELLDRNATTVPGYGPHLNLAGALQLTATSVGTATGPGEWREPVARPDVAVVLREFLALGDDAPLVLGLVGEPGSGRSTELARLAARRARGPLPAPTVWLRGAELRPADGGVRDAVERSLRTAARIVGAGASGEPPYASPDAVAALARAAGRPLLVLLDAPEEMPPVLAHALADWAAGTADWLRAGNARLVVACRPEFWDRAGRLLPPALLYGPPGPPHAHGAPALPACLRLGDLDGPQAAAARLRYGVPEGALGEADAAHPLTLRLLSEVRAALPEDAGGSPSRAEVFAAHLDLVCLRVAVRLAAAAEPPVRGGGVRRLAARVAGQVHEAARRCLGPGQGELDREAFEELFPWRTGWASAVLTEGLLVPAGAGYRFAHEEAADWLQALHLDLDAALHALVHRWFALPPAAAAEAPVRLPSRPAARAGQLPPVPPAPPVAPPSAPRSLPVPRHRAGPVVQGLLAAPPEALRRHLTGLLRALDRRTPPPTRCAPRKPAPPPPPAPGLDLDLYADTVPDPRSPHPVLPAAPAPPAASSAPGIPVPPAGLPGWLARGIEERPPTRPGRRSPRGGRTQEPPPWPGWGATGGPAGGVWELPHGGPAASAAGATALPAGGGTTRSGSGTAAWRPAGRGGPGARPTAGSAQAWRQDGEPGGWPEEVAPAGRVAAPGPAERQDDALWWAAHLLREVLLRLPDAAVCLGVLRDLAARVAVRAVERGGFTPEGMGALGDFGPWFWRRVRLPLAERLDLLRLLLPADGPPGGPPGGSSGGFPGGRAGGGASGGPDRADRFLTAVAGLLCAAPAAVLPVVCGWFDDDRPLQASPGMPGPRLTVASAAQALLHTHRGLAVDDLTEALVAAAHPCADELLAALAEDEPSAVCRAVDRWAHDPRPVRHAAAAAYGPRTALAVRSGADRELLRYAALALLSRPGDASLHGAALGMLVRDPATRGRHLPAALDRFAAADPRLPAAALAAALPTHPEPVLAAFRTRLRAASPGRDEADLLAELAAVTEPALARRTAALVQDHLRYRPSGAAGAARFLDVRLEQGPGVRSVVLPLTTALLRDHPAPVRGALVAVLAAPGSHLSRPLRQELLDVALETERDPDVLDALLTAAADGAGRRPPPLTHDLVRRVALLLGRTPEGAARFDSRVVELAATTPDFARLLLTWLTDTAVWDPLLGPSARRRLARTP